MRPIIQSKKQNKNGKKAFFVFAVFLMIFFSIKPGSLHVVSGFFNTSAVPFWNARNAVENKLPSPDIILRSKTSLIRENESLQEQINILNRNLKGYNVVIQENLEYKKLFAGEKEGAIFAAVIAQPTGFLFDTLLLNVGNESGVENGEFVLGDENIVLGKVIETYSSSAKVKAFSSSGEVTDAFLGPENIPVQLKGAGGGAYTAELPHELDVREGDAALLPGSKGFIVAYVQSKEENTTDSFQKLYLRSPVNIFELKFVQVLRVMNE